MRYPRVRLRAIGAVGCVTALAALAACSSGGSGGSSGSNSNSGTITVAVVSNPLITGQMIPLTSSSFEKQYPGIKVKFATYTEGDLRAAIEKNVSTHSNAFNVIMIGPYEAPLFAKNGWLTDLSKQYIASDPGYDAGDLLPPIAKALSYKGDLYAAPFYGESSMMFYNKTLFQAAGLTMPANPTWDQIQGFAAKLNQPGKVSGICLRGLAGWGDNMAALDTVVNTFGGQWFDMNWKPQLTSPRVHRGGELLRQPGPQVRRARRVQRQLQPAADAVRPGQVRDVVRRDGGGDLHRDHVPGRLQADRLRPGAGRTRPSSSGWLWSWALGIPQGVSNSGAAWKYVSWATSKQYDQLVGKKYGWSAVPPGTRTSLYSNPDYQKAAKPFADITLQSINSTDPEHPTLNPVPYVGVQYVDIPQFESLGLTVGQQIAGAIAGTESVSQALQAGQSAASQYTAAQLSGG